MKLALVPCLALLSCLSLGGVARAAETPFPAEDARVESGFETAPRTYYREHRLRAYERTQAATSQGATCVTPQIVCWIGEPMAEGDICSCESRPLGVIEGLVGG